MTLATICRGGMLRVISALFASPRFVRSGPFATRDDSPVAAQEPCAPFQQDRSATATRLFRYNYKAHEHRNTIRHPAR
jgi:hypothetical protein